MLDPSVYMSPGLERVTSVSALVSRNGMHDLSNRDCGWQVYAWAVCCRCGAPSCS